MSSRMKAQALRIYRLWVVPLLCSLSRETVNKPVKGIAALHARKACVLHTQIHENAYNYTHLITGSGRDIGVKLQTSLLLSCKCTYLALKITWFIQKNQWDLYQNKVTSSLTAIQRPGHWAENCKMVYWKLTNRKILLKRFWFFAVEVWAISRLRESFCLNPCFIVIEETGVKITFHALVNITLRRRSYMF